MLTLDRTLLALLLAVPAALVADTVHAGPIAVFILSGLSLIPLAKFLSDATEELATRAGPAVGGLMNATFGNATELLIGVFALSSGLVAVVQATIVGSILGNLLFVLGAALALGGMGRVRQRFSVTAARANASILLLAATALVIPAVFFLSAGGAIPTEELSLAVAALMVLGYGANLVFSLYTHRHLFVVDGDTGLEPLRAPWVNIAILLATTVAIAIMSELFVGTLEPIMQGFGWTPLFVGAIVVAILGNAAEHVSAVVAARRDRMDLALQIAMGSATQVLMLILPILVFVSALFTRQLTLVFTPFELIALVFAIFVTNSVIEDGETNWLEGVQLLIVYLIIAVGFFLLP